MNREQANRTIIVGVVGHISPGNLSDFRELLESLSYFRLIRFQDSDNKIWLVEQEDKR